MVLSSSQQVFPGRPQWVGIKPGSCCQAHPIWIRLTRLTRLGGDWQQEEDGVRKEHLMLPLQHARASPREVGSVTLFRFLALEMQYWTDSNSIPFNISLCSIYTDKLVPHTVLGETERKEKRPHCVAYWGIHRIVECIE